MILVDARQAEAISAAVRDTCLVGTADGLVEQIRALQQDGLREPIFATGTAAERHLAQHFPHQVTARL